MKFLLSLLVASSAVTNAFSSCQGSPNTLPISDDLTLVKSVENGALYHAGGPNVDPPLLVAKVSGDAYSMGFALGQLLAEEVKEIYSQVPAFLEASLPDVFHTLPQKLQDFIVNQGAHAALQLIYKEDIIPDRFKEEMQGLADGSGADLADVTGFAMLPELLKAHCSMAGAFDHATTADDQLLVLRALDWATNGPFQKYPLVTVFDPTEGHKFSTLGWAGFTGALTGYSVKMSICEKVWLTYNGSFATFGSPWTFVLRDVLQFDQSIDEALQRIEDAERTCSIFVGLGARDTMEFKAVRYSHDTASIFNDSYPAHTYHPDLTFINKHTQPSSDPCMDDLFNKYYGEVEAKTIFTNITAQQQTGDMHIAVFDFKNNNMYISNAGPSQDFQDGQPAYERHFTLFHMDDWFDL